MTIVQFWTRFWNAWLSMALLVTERNVPFSQFCGHQLDRVGIHKTQDKIEAVRRASSPQDVSQLRSFLGLINYYNQFLPNYQHSWLHYTPFNKGAEMELVSSL